MDGEIADIQENVVSDQSKQGAGEGLGNKIDNADIRNWVEHKMHKVGFFLNEWKRLSEPERIKSFGSAADCPKLMMEKGIRIDDIINMNENSNFLNTSEEVIELVTNWGNELRDQYLLNGLSEQEAARRLEEYGPNILPEKEGTPDIIKFLHEIGNPFAILLWVAALLAFIAFGLTYKPDDPNSDKSNAILAGFIILIILLTGMFSFFQNKKGEGVMAGFKSFADAPIEVIRGKETKDLMATSLVIGDVITIKSGGKIPADMRVFKCSSDLSVDNSSLTGEPEAIKLSTRCGTKGMEDPKESKNLAFFSTLCQKGTGTGIVIKTGSNTFMGRIADLAQSAEPTVTTLQIELDQLIKFLAVVAIAFGVIFFSFGFLITDKWLDNLINAIGLIVANIPEGLLGAITLALTITAEKMFDYNVLVKNLGSIETLGALTCICSDKTGTLTKNKMTVQHLWYDLKIKNARQGMGNIKTGLEEIKCSSFEKNDPSFELFQIIGICGSVARFKTLPPEDFKPLQDEKREYLKENPEIPKEKIGEYVDKVLKPKYQEEYKSYIEMNIDEAETSKLNLKNI